MTELAVQIRLTYPNFTLDLAHAFSLNGITALFGQSGCGKSTLLRVIAGLERGAKGTVRYASEEWQGPRSFVPPHRRGVGYVFQDARLFPHLSVLGNLRYAEKRAAGVDGRFSLGDVVEVLDLAPLLQRRPTSLSGGERQRVAMGRTLLTRPRLLLMDEPLAALDTRRKGEILPYISRLPQVFDVPIIYVTHSLDEVTQLADRMVALSGGAKLAAGGVSETLERLDLTPATGTFEAGAVLTGRVVSRDQHFCLTRLAVGDHHLDMPGLDLPKDRPLRLRVRARDVALATERPSGISIRNILPGTVLDITEEANTAFAEVLVDIGNGQHLRSRISRAAAADLGLTVGTSIFAMIKSISFDNRSEGDA